MFKPQSSQPISMQICNVLIKNYLHQLGCSWHPVCRTSFASCTEISNFSRTLLRHFRRTISDATDDRSEVTCFLGVAEALLKLLRAVERSISGIALVCGGALDCSFVYERPGPCYRRAVFLGDDLAAPGSACSSPSHREGAILGPVRRRRLPATLESIDKHEYCGYTTRSKSFLFRPCLPVQWTALNSRWTHRHLGGAAQRVHV
jgi:hypothetical protein